jgi:hypothetical protein
MHAHAGGVIIDIVKVQSIHVADKATRNSYGPIVIEDQPHAHTGKKNIFVPELSVTAVHFDEISQGDFAASVTFSKNGMDLICAFGCMA